MNTRRPGRCRRSRLVWVLALAPLWLPLALVVMCLLIVTAPVTGPVAAGVLLAVVVLRPRFGSKQSRQRGRTRRSRPVAFPAHRQRRPSTTR